MQKFIVIKVDDAERFLPNHDKIDLNHILHQIDNGRKLDGKKKNSYIVINTDENYASEVKEIMRKHGHWNSEEEKTFM